VEVGRWVSSRCMEPTDAEQALRVRPNRPRLEQLTLTSSTPGGLCQSRHSSSAGLTCASREIRSTRPAEHLVLAFKRDTKIVSVCGFRKHSIFDRRPRTGGHRTLRASLYVGNSRR